MRLTILLVLAGACTFQVAGLPVNPKTDPDPVTNPSTPPSTTPPASTPTPSDPPVPDLSQLPDLAGQADMANAPDLAPMTVVCNQDCNVTVPNNTTERIVCELGQSCDVTCSPGAHCTLDCLGDAKCICRGMGCTITDCAPVLKCKGGVISCNQKCD